MPMTPFRPPATPSTTRASRPPSPASSWARPSRRGSSTRATPSPSRPPPRAFAAAAVSTSVWPRSCAAGCVVFLAGVPGRVESLIPSARCDSRSADTRLFPGVDEPGRRSPALTWNRRVPGTTCHVLWGEGGDLSPGRRCGPGRVPGAGGGAARGGWGCGGGCGGWMIGERWRVGPRTAV